VIDRMQLGEVPPKHHVALRGKDGTLRWEECLTRRGFDGAYTIVYHQERPHEQLPADVRHGWIVPAPSAPPPLARS